MDNNTINSRMKTVEWVILLILSIIVDVVQIILNLAFGSGVLINRVITVVFGALMGGYLHMRGVSLVNPRVMLRFGGTVVGEFIPMIDFLPIWVIGTIWTWVTTKSTIVAKTTSFASKVSSAKSGKSGGSNGGALNKDGIRMPETATGAATSATDSAVNGARSAVTPLVVDGIRKPLK